MVRNNETILMLRWVCIENSSKRAIKSLHEDSWKRRQRDPPWICSEEEGIGEVIDDELSPGSQTSQP
jgi:hypothetical protein